ncbi:MAG: GDP-mannose 4,6-dehydratase [Bacteroidetes bacterium]|nr:GDP-mannose 4,6-dehydratase [Bacteroidota bacterium]
MKILITGLAGFVSRHFLNLLSEKKEDSFVIGIDRNEISTYTGSLKQIKIENIKSDLKDKEFLKKIIADFYPEYILHLASSSSVFKSWQHPADVFINNNLSFLTILDAVKESGRNIRILSTGTSDVYGISANTNPHIKETAALHPANPYAVSKASQELMAKVYVDSFGIDIIQTRSFTHFGPFQNENFVLAKFAKQLTLIKKGLQPPVLTTGNIDITRDLSDVRDVVNAYELLLKKGKSGEIYNVCSGKGIHLRDVLLLMQKKLNVDVEIKPNETLFRKGEIQSIIGDNEKIFIDTGWQPTITLEKSIEDLLDYWDEQTNKTNNK